MRIHENETYQLLVDEIEEMSRQISDKKLYNEKLDYLEALADATADLILRAVVLYHRSDIPYEEKDFELCRCIVEDTLKYCKEIDFTYYIMRCYNTLAILDSGQSDFYSSIDNYLKAFFIADVHPEYKYAYALLNNIGNLFVWLDEHEAAIDYLIRGYDKYHEEEIDSTFILSVIILNIVEEYSLLHEYDKAKEWSEYDIDFIEEVDGLIKRILILNEIDLLYASGKKEKVLPLARQVICKAEEEIDFIYMFRTYIRLLDYAIKFNDKETADYVLEHTEMISKESPLNTFQYDYTVLKYQYYEAFEKQKDDGRIAKQLIKEYVETSDHIVMQMRNTYTRRILTETELLKERNEKEDALNQSRQLQKDIELDYFTHILNKVSVEKYINEAVSNKTKDINQALFLIDIDYFKHVNDNYGHERGDELILAVVDMISSSCSKNMLFGRFGGDEFVLYIKNAGRTEFFSTFAEELLEKARRIEIEEGRYITLSMGICIVENNELRFKEIFQYADEALYETKRNGRNGFTFYRQI